MTTPIALIGMPGGGKSTVGRHLARRIGVGFVDTDVVIERRIGCPIRIFFEREGEARFRDIESSVLAELVADGAQGVIATGGGIVLQGANRRLLSESTLCVYLHSTPQELFRRLRRDTKRPLLQVADPRARLRELYAQRDRLYRQAARFVVETGHPSMGTLVNMVLMQLELAGAIDPARVPSPIGAAAGGH